MRDKQLRKPRAELKDSGKRPKKIRTRKQRIRARDSASRTYGLDRLERLAAALLRPLEGEAMRSPIKPWLDEAGRFPIAHIGGIPHYNEAVLLNAPKNGRAPYDRGYMGRKLGNLQ